MKIYQIIVFNKISKIKIKLIKQINVNKLFSMIQIFKQMIRLKIMKLIIKIIVKFNNNKLFQTINFILKTYNIKITLNYKLITNQY